MSSSQSDEETVVVRAGRISREPVSLAAVRSIRVETKVEAAYHEIRARILDGTIAPGSSLSQEALAASIGLSTTPLREALRRLEGEGLLTTAAHKGITVAPLSQSELHEVLAIRLQLDPYAASEAAKHGSEEEIENALHLAAREIPATSLSKQMALNRAFHRAIYAASGNRLLTQFLDSLWDRTDRYRLAAPMEERHRALVSAEHQAIADALAQRDARRAALLMQRHVKGAREVLSRFATQ